MKLGLVPHLAVLSAANYREEHHHALVFSIFPYEILNF